MSDSIIHGYRPDPTAPTVLEEPIPIRVEPTELERAVRRFVDDVRRADPHS